ncbi:RASF6 protein, partial [Trogon melanurus]|nr:RASF6 protein [Trogon melanurus]
FYSREQLSSLLKTYNSYYSDQENLQLSCNQEEGSKPFIEGILSIFWGVRHPIRLKIQDEKQIPSFVTLKSTENVGLFPSKRGMTRWGEFDDLHHISGETLKSPEEKPNLETSYSSYESRTLRSGSEQEHDCATLPRAVSAAVRKRTKFPTIARTEEETHRFSINGHFYNYETSVFTPAFGSETKIRINSRMRTRQVIEQLLRKFKIENSPHEFALYIIHASGEKKQLRSGDVPLLHRLLQGPSENIAKFFLMDRDVEEISSDVAQYIQFHLPFLESILHRINEEEQQEIQQTVARYLKEKSIICQHLHSRTAKKTETTV